MWFHNQSQQQVDVGRSQAVGSRLRAEHDFLHSWALFAFSMAKDSQLLSLTVAMSSNLLLKAHKSMVYWSLAREKSLATGCL